MNQPTAKSNSMADFLSIATQARSLSEQIEHGQATTPCTDAFARLIEAAPSQPRRISIACLSEAARCGVLADLAKVDGVRIDICKFGSRLTTGTIEIQLALIAELGHSRGAWQEFVEGGQLLVVAGQHFEAEDSIQSSLIQDLLICFPTLLPWITDATGEAEHPWWQSSSIASHPAAAKAQRRTSPELLASLLNPDSVPLQSLHTTIQEERKGTWLTAALNSLTARIQREAQRIKESRNRIESAAKAVPTKPAASEKELMRVKDMVSAALSKVEKELTLKIERASQPLGQWSVLIREIASSLHVEDLEKTQTSSVFKLSVNASHLAKINRRIEHALRQELTLDLASVNRQVAMVVNEHHRAAPTKDTTLSRTSIAMLKEQAIWPAVENLMAIGKESQIELVRRGFFDVLTAGRQKVFIVIMFVSLMGRMGLPNLFESTGSKAAFGIFMAAVMIGSMINSVLLWRREKQVQSERELTKIRESLFNDACKVIDQVEKVKLAAVRDYIKETGAGIESQAKQRLEDCLVLQKNNLDDELRTREQSKRALETRAKIVADIERQVLKLSETANTVWLTTKTALRKCVQWIRVESNDTMSMSSAATETEQQPSAPSMPAASARPSRMKAKLEQIESDSATAEHRTSGLAERRRLRLGVH